MQSDRSYRALNPVVYANIALRINTKYNNNYVDNILRSNHAKIIFGKAYKILFTEQNFDPLG